MTNREPTALEAILQAREVELAEYRKMHSFLREHLVMWASSGIPAPVNELQSIHGWLGYLNKGVKETAKAMRNRMLLLMQAANELHAEGEAAENAVGIYNKRQRIDFEDGPALGLYRHTDGGYYEVIGRARDSKDGSTVILYEHRWPFEAGTWTRPIEEWASRFTRVRADELTNAQLRPRAEAQAIVTASKQARKARA